MLEPHDAPRSRTRIAGIMPRRGDAQALPYPDFDAAHTIVRAEGPDRDAALRELARVLKPGGRGVVGGAIRRSPPGAVRGLTDRARAAGFSYERRVGGRLGCYARVSGGHGART